MSAVRVPPEPPRVTPAGFLAWAGKRPEGFHWASVRGLEWGIVELQDVGDEPIGEVGILPDGSVIVVRLVEGSLPRRSWYPARRVERVIWLEDEAEARRMACPKDESGACQSFKASTVLPGACRDCGWTEGEHARAAKSSAPASCRPWERLLRYEAAKPERKALVDALRAEAGVRPVVEDPGVLEILYPAGALVEAALEHARGWRPEGSLAHSRWALFSGPAWPDIESWSVRLVRVAGEDGAVFLAGLRAGAAASAGDEGHDGDEES